MSYVKPEAREAQGQVEAKTTGRSQIHTATLQCLVVSQDADRGGMLCHAAAEGGWEPVICADARQAATASERTRFRLVLVDTDAASGAAIEELHRLCDALSNNNGMLLVVCGPPGNPQEEIWARQIGVWLYLPGVANGAGVVALCEQASQISGEIAERQQRSQLTSEV